MSYSVFLDFLKRFKMCSFCQYHDFILLVVHFVFKHCINVDVYHIQNVQNMKINKARFKSVLTLFVVHPLLLFSI